MSQNSSSAASTNTSIFLNSSLYDGNIDVKDFKNNDFIEAHTDTKDLSDVQDDFQNYDESSINELLSSVSLILNDQDDNNIENVSANNNRKVSKTLMSSRMPDTGNNDKEVGKPYAVGDDQSGVKYEVLNEDGSVASYTVPHGGNADDVNKTTTTTLDDGTKYSTVTDKDGNELSTKVTNSDGSYTITYNNGITNDDPNIENQIYKVDANGKTTEIRTSNTDGTYTVRTFDEAGKPIDTMLDFNELTKNFESKEDKEKLIEVLKDLPAEVLNDLSKEIREIYQHKKESMVHLIHQAIN